MEFKLRASDRMKIVKNEIAENNLYLLQSIGNLYASSHRVDRDEFQEFTKNILIENPGILALYWIPRIPESECLVFKEKASLEGFTIDVPVKNEYFPIYYLESLNSNKNIIGYNMASDPERLRAMQTARDLATTVITQQVKLLGDDKAGFGYELYLPIYLNDVPHSTLEERQKNLAGFVAMPFNVAQVAELALKNIEPGGVDILIYDLEGNKKKLIYSHYSRLRKSYLSLPGFPSNDIAAGFEFDEKFNIADRQWQFTSRPAPEFIRAHRTFFPLYILFISILLTVLLVSYLFDILSRNMQVESMVNERTEELRKSEEKYCSLVENLPDVVWVSDESGKTVFVSENVSKVYGFSSKEICAAGKAVWFDRIHPDELEMVQEKYRLFLSNSEKFDVEYRIRTKDGVWIWVHDRAVMSYKEGGMKYAIGTFFDITEHKNAENTIIRLASFPELNPNPVIEITSSNQITYINPAARKLFLDLEILGFKHPFLKGADKIITNCSWESKDIIQREVRVDNMYYQQFFSCLPEQRILHLYSMDVTERRLAEEKARQIANEWDETFNSISDMITVQSKDYKIIRANKAYAAAFGVRPDELVGRVCCGVIHGTGKSISNCPCQRTLEKKEYSSLEIFEPRLGKYLEITTSPIINDKGEVEAVVHVMKDISKRKEVELLKDEFVSTVSHELRTPLSIIKEGVSVILEKISGAINDKQEKILVSVRGSIDRLARIIDSLLDISKIQVGKMEIKKEIVNLSEIAEQVVIAFLPKAKAKNLEIRMSFPEEAVNIHADKDKIIGIFTNLINNALKFTEKGYIEVIIKDLENEIECAVIDTGFGISKDDLLRVFGKFQQFNRPFGGSGEKGTGLGLAITKGLVEVHNGRIWVESELQKGSKFIFTLPKAGST